MRSAARVLGHLLALVAGAAAALLGSFTFAYSGAGVPVGMLVGLALCLAVFTTAGLLLRSRGGPGAAVAGWLVVVTALSLERPEGDLIVPATVSGYVWLLGGFLVAVLSIALRYDQRDAVRAPSGRPPIGR